MDRRAGGRCEYCRSPENISSAPYCADHIEPESAGGATDFENLAWSCIGCNGKKYAKREAQDPQSGAIVPLFNPRSQNWADHFAWSADWTEIIGLTPTGRATVNTLEMNRSNLINLRRMLLKNGEHPAQQNENEE